MNELDDFLTRRTAKQTAEQERLQQQQAREAHLEAILQAKTYSEWKSLGDKMRELAVGREIDGAKFIEMGPSLCLNNVAATLIHGMIVDGIPTNLKIVFSRIPTGNYMDESRIGNLTWSVNPSVVDEDIMWHVSPERGAFDVDTNELALKVVQTLVNYSDSYQASYARP